mmetsp:Transcript_17575/g.49467  ORF Transcript_17575/g.49467 Transcript_17575/m.49467 type:complete len:196 (+) Transcript_17575:82-669(+)
MAMEFPDLGEHCEVADCKQLDFLPFKCDACARTFCLEHRTYADHHCEKGKKKDNQAFFCPDCGMSINVGYGGNVDEKLSIHYATECPTSGFEAPKEQPKKDTGRCFVRGCGKKELVPVECRVCHRSVCLDHRFERDHNCKGAPAKKGPKKQKPAATTTTRNNQRQRNYGSSRDCRNKASENKELGCSKPFECEVQ